ncbi:MAG: GNAT family N-acetyltransferase [Pseudomonadota bacterium]|nr:GNAT family N-acetyltransferase [Pseudomonadota bacterium]
MADVSVEKLDNVSRRDLNDLCDAAEAAIEEGGGFGWLDVPERGVLENYWRGVLLVPERTLFVGRLDGVIAGSAQLGRPTKNNEAQSHAAMLTTNFVAPWARGYGIGFGLIDAVERLALKEEYTVLNLDVRATQDAAIARYDSLGFVRWGENPYYARVGDKWVTGYYYFKELWSEESE